MEKMSVEVAMVLARKGTGRLMRLRVNRYLKQSKCAVCNVVDHTILIAGRSASFAIISPTRELRFSILAPEAKVWA